MPTTRNGWQSNSGEGFGTDLPAAWLGQYHYTIPHIHTIRLFEDTTLKPMPRRRAHGANSLTHWSKTIADQLQLLTEQRLSSITPPRFSLKPQAPLNK